MQENKNNTFGVGFVLGLLFGVALTLLIVTKKGRKLLRTLSEEGIENMKDFKTKLKQADIAIDEDLYYDDLEEETSPPSKNAVVEKKEVQKTVADEFEKKQATSGVKKSTKRLFRGIPKKG